MNEAADHQAISPVCDPAGVDVVNTAHGTQESVPRIRNFLWNSLLGEIPVDGTIAIRANRLLDFHHDPADRFTVATALDGHSLLTADRHILYWDGDLKRLDARQ